MGQITSEHEHLLPDKQYAISVCRIETENNIHIILEAFFHQNEIPLVIVGNWKNSDYGLRLWGKYGICDHVFLFDPIYEAEKINRLRSNALVYIHGHSAGGTNPSLVEAMFLGLPVFAFDCIYNRLTTENKAIYWDSVESLGNIIDSTHICHFEDLGNDMKQIADRRYRWKVINKKYEDLYAKVTSNKIDVGR